ncbi:SH3 domain-containing protein [Mesorhizobium sp.]|uniref:SH3 domain-containing protein n=1 Tax=Mesorhizobium sp. TaxID=1871066 RepID=UPI00344794D6
MKRKVTLRSTLLIAAPLLLAALPALAEDAPGPIISIIGGLAPDDLLNIRATASADGKIAARLPNGAAVKNFGCNLVNGYPWCKVEDTQDAHIVGWAPARYLSPNNPAPAPEDTAVPAAEAAAPQDGNAPQAPGAPSPDIAARLGGSEPADPAIRGRYQRDRHAGCLWPRLRGLGNRSIRHPCPRRSRRHPLRAPCRPADDPLRDQRRT